MSDSSKVKQVAPTKLDLKFTSEPNPLFPVANAIKLQLQPNHQLWRSYRFNPSVPLRDFNLQIEYYDSQTFPLKEAHDLARQLVYGKLYQEQCTAIGQQIDQGQFNQLEAHKVNGNTEQTSSWSVKEADMIWADLKSLIDKVCEQMHEHIGVASQDMTLALPATHLPYLFKQVGLHCSVLEQLNLLFPNLRIIAIPELTTEQGNHALLVCKHQAFGPAGYFAIGAQANIVFEDDVATKTKLFIPVYGLVITNPEQIAVLTGI